MKVLDLFSGIGGFSFGLERAGMQTVAFCESDPYCQAVLRRHWPDVPVYDDVRTFTTAWLMADAAQYRRDKRGADANSIRLEAGSIGHSQFIRACPVDLICGGFPCQDISVAGKGAGIAGERSGLWSEFARIIGEVRPRYIIVENVSALLGRGLARVLGDLAALGFDAEWHCIPASAVGAPHRRDRIWIIAWQRRWVADAECISGATGRKARDVVTATGTLETNGKQRQRGWDAADNSGAVMAHTNKQPLLGPTITWPKCHPWLSEPDVGRVAHGVPARVDRLRVLGNAIVPQIAEIIGRAILEAEHEHRE